MRGSCGRALSATVLAVALLALLATPAFAERATGTTCPPPFAGAVTLAQEKQLPRTVAALEAGVYTEQEIDDLFAAIDVNDNGLICYQEVHGFDKASESSGRQYDYNLVDDQAAAR